jgi:hypothetical protein
LGPSHAPCGAGVVVVMGVAARWCFDIVVVVVEVVLVEGGRREAALGLLHACCG